MTSANNEELCWCGHSRQAHQHVDPLPPHASYCVHCYWNRYPYRVKPGAGQDLHNFRLVA